MKTLEFLKPKTTRVLRKAPAVAPHDEYRIPTWDEIVDAARTGGVNMSRAHEFERIRQAVAAGHAARAADLRFWALVLVTVTFALLLAYPTPSTPLAKRPINEWPARCEGLKICYPLAVAPSCATRTDCAEKAKQAQRVADKLLRERDAAVTNRYEAYRHLDATARFLTSAGVEDHPQVLPDWDEQLLTVEQELEEIARGYRIRHHRLQQRNMHYEMALNLRRWQAHFPDSHSVWFQEALEIEHKMRGHGTWPDDFERS